MDVGATTILAVPKNAVIDILKRGQGDAFDDGSRNNGQHQESKSDKEEDGEGRRGFEQHSEGDDETCSIGEKEKKSQDRIMDYGKKSNDRK